MRRKESASGHFPSTSFEGGQELAINTQSGMQAFGQTFLDFGARASQIQGNDPADQQKFLTDFQAAIGQSPIAQMQLSPEVQQAVRQIPACQQLMGST